MKRKREVIKRVIAYMTLGIDVSRLFTDMIMVYDMLILATQIMNCWHLRVDHHVAIQNTRLQAFATICHLFVTIDPHSMHA